MALKPDALHFEALAAPCRLLELPPELRILIYDYLLCPILNGEHYSPGIRSIPASRSSGDIALVTDGTTVLQTRGAAYPLPELANLLQICKQIKHEALERIDHHISSREYHIRNRLTDTRTSATAPRWPLMTCPLFKHVRKLSVHFVSDIQRNRKSRNIYVLRRILGAVDYGSKLVSLHVEHVDFPRGNFGRNTDAVRLRILEIVQVMDHVVCPVSSTPSRRRMMVLL